MSSDFQGCTLNCCPSPTPSCILHPGIPQTQPCEAVTPVSAQRAKLQAQGPESHLQQLLGGGRQLLVLCGSGQNPGEPPWPSPRLQPRGPSQALPPQPQLQGEQLPRATPPVAPPGLRAEVSSSPGVPRAGPPRVPPRSGSGLTWTEAPCRPPWSLATPSVHVVTWYPPSQALDTRHPRGLARRALWAEQRSAGTCAAPSGPPVAHTVPPEAWRGAAPAQAP